MSLLRRGPARLLINSAIGLIPHLVQNAVGFLDPDPSSDRQELVASRRSHFKNQGENRFEHRSHSKNKRNRAVFGVYMTPNTPSPPKHDPMPPLPSFNLR